MVHTIVLGSNPFEAFSGTLFNFWVFFYALALPEAVANYSQT
jgi:hypothetical protein